MARIHYAILCSADGFIEDDDGNFDWSEPTEEEHQLFNDLERGIGTALYGRRMYETLRVWETWGDEESEVTRDFAHVWRDTDKIIFSRTLDDAEITTARTRIERTFSADDIRALKETSDRDISVGGPGLAAAAFAAGLVDEIHLMVLPLMIGDGKRALPRQRLDLELVESREFASGAVYLHYAVR